LYTGISILYVSDSSLLIKPPGRDLSLPLHILLLLLVVVVVSSRRLLNSVNYLSSFSADSYIEISLRVIAWVPAPFPEMVPTGWEKK
jgi:hypothetical protein